MSWRKSVFGGGVALGLALALACGQEDGAGSASSAGKTASDVAATNPTIAYGNTSDPEAKVLNGVLYLFTSSDLPLPNGGGPNYYPGGASNYYPMNTTRLHALRKDSEPWTLPVPSAPAAGWTSLDVFSESTISAYWNVVPNTNHLWAPAIAEHGGRYYLLVPDVEGTNPTQGYIYVSTAPTPAGDFNGGYIGGWVWIDDGNGGYVNYASDPSVEKDASGTSYLAWATGDFNTQTPVDISCGGLAVGELQYNDNAQPYTSAAYVPWGWQPVQFTNPDQVASDGFAADGLCAGKGHPYMEGPSLSYRAEYQTGDGPWYLVFAAYPDANHGSREKIAYARAWSPLGPWKWEGVLMDQSETEWTNQASMVKWGGDNLLFYHDSASGSGPQRRVHAECLNIRSDGSILPVTRTANGIKCATHYPVTYTVTARTSSVGKSARITDNVQNSATVTWAANSTYYTSVTKTWSNMTSGAKVYAYCGDGTNPVWSGCSSTFKSACYLSGGPRSVTATCN